MTRPRQERIHPVSLILFGFLSAGAYITLLIIPISRQIGTTFRNTLYVLPAVFLTAFLAHRVTSPYVKALLKAILFAMLIAPYSGLINSGLSDQYALGGVVPWSDAFTLQLNTQRFLYGGMMGQATAIRPISAVAYAFFLKLSGNDYFALHLFLTVLSALSVLTAGSAVNRCYGSLTAGFFTLCAFFYARQRLGTFMTEPYGFICGNLSCAFFLYGIARNNPLLMLPGALALSIGLNARPAALFLFPFIGIWFFFIFMKRKKQRLILSALMLGVMLCGFALNSYTQRIVYGPQNIPNRQAAEMIYGLCRGGESWGDVVFTPEMTALNRSQNVIADVIDLCAPLIREHPENILLSLKRIFWDSLIQSPYYGAFSFINGNPTSLQTPVRYGMMVLWLCGFVCLCVHRREARYSFLLAGALAVTVSMLAAVPFTSNYLRLYAVSVWIPAVICGVFPERLAGKYLPILHEESEEKGSLPLYGSGIVLFLLTFTAVFAPGYIRNHPLPIPAADSSLCGEGEAVLVTSIDRGSYIYLTHQDALPYEHIPWFRLPYVRQHIHDTASIEMFDFTDAIDTPTAIIRAIDLSNLEDALIFSPLELAEGIEGMVQMCGSFMDPPILRADRFFIPTSIYPIQ